MDVWNVEVPDTHLWAWVAVCICMYALGSWLIGGRA